MAASNAVRSTMFPPCDAECHVFQVFLPDTDNRYATVLKIGIHEISLHDMAAEQLMMLADGLYDAARAIADRSRPSVTTTVTE